MKLYLALALILLCPMRAADWRIGSMSIQWLDGFERTSNEAAVRFVGPGGEVVLVTAMGIRNGADVERAVKTYLMFGEKELPRLSAAKGKDVMKLSRETVSENITLFSTAALSKKDAQMFYLQFLAVSSTGRAALITVEGRGDPAQQFQRFRPLLGTINWSSNEKKG
jgi:hypothetical protein